MDPKLKLKIIGTSGFTPFKSRTAKLFTSCRIFFGAKSLQIDIGNPYRGLPVDYLIITHTHYDHIQALNSLPIEFPTSSQVEVLIPSLTFMEEVKAKNPMIERIRVFKTKIRLDGLSVQPFNVLHSSTTLTYGLKFHWGSKSMVWVPDWCVIPDLIGAISGADYLFLGAAAMKKPISHKGFGHCQGAVFGMLEKISKMKNPPKKIYLIHFGMGLRPIAVKTRFLQKSFPKLNIDSTHDNMRMDL